MKTNIDYASLIRAIKTSLTVTDYCNNILGMNVIEGERCSASYRGGSNPTSFISYGDSYTDFGYPGGPRHHCDVIQLCADAKHNGDRSQAIYELARSHITADRLAEISNDHITWSQHVKTLERRIDYWHSQLRPEDREYLHSRRINDSCINRLKIGYSATMKRLIVPYQHNGHFVYYSGRDVTGEWKINKKRAKYAKMKISHFYVENVPFGLHTLEPEHRAKFPAMFKTSDGREYPYSDYLCILEGQIDALSFEQEGFIINSPVGGYFNEMQIPYFLSIARQFKKVFICFDNDGAGTGFQLKMAQQLFQHKIPFVSCIVPKKIPGMTCKAKGQCFLTHDSNIVVLNTNSDLSKINPGDIFTIKSSDDYYVVESVGLNNQITLKSAYPGPSEVSEFEITQYIKDVSDYYTAGGNLGDLVANADDGIVALGRLIGSDYKNLRDFLKECAKTNGRAELMNLLEKCTGIQPKIKDALLKEALRIPTENDIVNEILGYTDKSGKKHKPKFLLRYVEDDGFYEYVHGVWLKRRETKIKEYIADILGDFRRSDRINGALNLLKISAAVDLPNSKLNNFFNLSPVANFINGIIDLNAPDENIKSLKPHKPEYNSSIQINYMYNSNAKCPRIMKFLHDVLFYKNEQITQQKIDMIQEFFAYPLFPTNPIHKMLFLLGDGRNGKGTLLELLRSVYGDECVSFVNPAQFNVDFQRIHLLNSMVNICFDAEKDFRASQEIIKQVVAGENIMACYKFQNHVQFRPRAKLVTACNNLVRVADVTRGFLSRCAFVTFHKCYEGHENFNLINELKEELPGFFNWILEGYIKLRRNIKSGKGFTLSEEHYETMKMFENNTSPVFEFYDDKIKLIVKKGIISTKEVHSLYCDWAEDAHYYILNRGSFTREFKIILKQRHPELFEKFGHTMTRKIAGKDYYDFTSIAASFEDKDVDMEENSPEVDMEENSPEVETNEDAEVITENVPANSGAETYEKKYHDYRENVEVINENVPTISGAETYEKKYHDEHENVEVLNENAPTNSGAETDAKEYHEDHENAEVLTVNVPTNSGAETDAKEYHDVRENAEVITENASANSGAETDAKEYHEDHENAEVLTVNAPANPGAETDAKEYHDVRENVEVITENASVNSSPDPEHDQDNAKTKITGAVVAENIPIVLPINYQSTLLTDLNYIMREEFGINMYVNDFFTKKEYDKAVKFVTRIVTTDFISKDPDIIRERMYWKLLMQQHGSVEQAVAFFLRNESQRRIKLRQRQERNAQNQQQAPQQNENVKTSPVKVQTSESDHTDMQTYLAQQEEKRKELVSNLCEASDRLNDAVSPNRPKLGADTTQIIDQYLLDARVQKVIELLKLSERDLFYDNRPAYDFWSELFRRFKRRHPMSNKQVVIQIVQMHWEKCAFKNDKWPLRKDIPDVSDLEY